MTGHAALTEMRRGLWPVPQRAARPPGDGLLSRLLTVPGGTQERANNRGSRERLHGASSLPHACAPGRALPATIRCRCLLTCPRRPACGCGSARVRPRVSY